MAVQVSVNVETFGNGKVSDDNLVDDIRDLFELRPAGIIDDLDLPWERLDKVDALKTYFNK